MRWLLITLKLILLFYGLLGFLVIPATIGLTFKILNGALALLSIIIAMKLNKIIPRLGEIFRNYTKSILIFIGFILITIAGIDFYLGAVKWGITARLHMNEATEVFAFRIAEAQNSLYIITLRDIVLLSIGLMLLLISFRYKNVPKHEKVD